MRPGVATSHAPNTPAAPLPTSTSTCVGQVQVKCSTCRRAGSMRSAARQAVAWQRAGVGTWHSTTGFTRLTLAAEGRSRHPTRLVSGNVRQYHHESILPQIKRCDVCAPILCLCATARPPGYLRHLCIQLPNFQKPASVETLTPLGTLPATRAFLRAARR